MENRVAIDLVGELLDKVTDEKVTALALLDFSVGLTLKRLAWLPAATLSNPFDPTRTVVVEYHLENVADTVVARLDGKCVCCECG